MSDKEIPLLSIVIPTRNRQKYCIAAIKDILSNNNINFELCIQDNSDNNEIACYIDNNYKNDSRLKYRYVPEQLNSVHNMNEAMELATGKYVCMIGDDDTVLPSIFEQADWANENNIDSLCSQVTVQYFWPGAYPNTNEGILSIIKTRINTDNKYTNLFKLRKLFKHGITRYLVYHLPKVYHGIIRRDCIYEIFKKTGHYFGGLSPDIYSTIALSGIVKNHKIIAQPITIAGACQSSSTSQNVNKGHRGELKDAPHLFLRGEYIWDDHIPPFYSVETIWAESAFKAIDEMKMTNIHDVFNYSYLVAYSALNNRNIFLFIMKKSFLKENYYIRNDKFIKLKIILSFFQVLLEFIIRKLFKDTLVLMTEHNIDNISVAKEKIIFKQGITN